MSSALQENIPALSVSNLSAGYGGPAVVAGVNFSVGIGETVTLLGPNGAGKSTIAGCVAGIVRRYGGEVRLSSEDISRWPIDRRSRSGLVLAPEGRRLFPSLSVEANLRLVWFARRGMASESFEEMRAEAYDRFPVLAQRKSQLAGSMSGGEQQMLAIARAIIQRPTALILDEPSTGLAPKMVEHIFGVIGGLALERSCGVLLLEQNAVAALRNSDRGYVLEKGQIVIAGPAEDLARDDRIRAAYLGFTAKKITSK